MWSLIHSSSRYLRNRRLSYSVIFSGCRLTRNGNIPTVAEIFRAFSLVLGVIKRTPSCRNLRREVGREGGGCIPSFDPYFDYSFNSVSHLSTSTRQRVRSNYQLSFSIWIFPPLFHSYFSSYDTTLDCWIYFYSSASQEWLKKEYRNLQTHEGLHKWCWLALCLDQNHLR